MEEYNKIFEDCITQRTEITHQFNREKRIFNRKNIILVRIPNFATQLIRAFNLSPEHIIQYNTQPNPNTIGQKIKLYHADQDDYRIFELQTNELKKKYFCVLDKLGEYPNILNKTNELSKLVDKHYMTKLENSLIKSIGANVLNAVYNYFIQELLAAFRNRKLDIIHVSDCEFHIAQMDPKDLQSEYYRDKSPTELNDDIIKQVFDNFKNRTDSNIEWEFTTTYMVSCLYLGFSRGEYVGWSESNSESKITLYYNSKGSILNQPKYNHLDKNFINYEDRQNIEYNIALLLKEANISAIQNLLNTVDRDLLKVIFSSKYSIYRDLIIQIDYAMQQYELEETCQLKQFTEIEQFFMHGVDEFVEVRYDMRKFINKKLTRVLSSLF